LLDSENAVKMVAVVAVAQKRPSPKANYAFPPI